MGSDTCVRKVVIADQKDYMITYHRLFPECLQRPLVITFGKASSGKSPTGFGTEFLLKYGFDTIYVAQDRYSSYQGLSRSMFKELISPYILGRQVFTYGSSLGGYAALYFGSCIGAHVIAMSPRASLSPSVRKHFPSVEKAGWVRKPKQAFQHVEIEGLARETDFSVGNVFLSYDPMISLDAWYIAHHVNSSFPEAQSLLIEQGMHSVSEAMQASGVLKEYLFYIFEYNKMLSVDVDVRKNPKLMSRKALEAFSDNDYSEAAACLQVALKKPDTRSLEVLRRLIVKGCYKIFPDQKYITPSLKKKICESVPLKADVTPKTVLINQILLHEKLLDFYSALNVARYGQVCFPDERSFRKKSAQLSQIVQDLRASAVALEHPSAKGAELM